MKASPGARSWIAAGVRHELLTRALPALRHDMAAPVSVIRMGLLLLKRQAASADTPMEERIGLIEGQLNDLVAAVRSLRDWELAASDEGITRGALVTQCTGLMRAAFELNGIELHVAEGLSAAQSAGEDKRFSAAAALRYMVLGALGFLYDSGGPLGGIGVEPDGPDALRFVARHGESEPADPLAGALRAPRKLAIDAIALQALADDLGYAVAVKDGAVRLSLTPN
jgi:signal transduction histidine kinase